MDFFGFLSNLRDRLFQILLLVIFIFVRIFICTVHMISQLWGGGDGDGAGDDSGRRGGRGPPPGSEDRSRPHHEQAAKLLGRKFLPMLLS